MTKTTRYIVNDLEMPLTFKQGNLQLKAGGYAPLRGNDEEEATIVWAIQKGWAHISDTKPTIGEFVLPEIDTSVPPAMRGLTFEELQEARKAKELEAAQLSEDNDNGDKGLIQPGIKTTALGQNGTKSAEFSTTSLGQKAPKAKKTEAAPEA